MGGAFWLKLCAVPQNEYSKIRSQVNLFNGFYFILIQVIILMIIIHYICLLEVTFKTIRISCVFK